MRLPHTLMAADNRIFEARVVVSYCSVRHAELNTFSMRRNRNFAAINQLFSVGNLCLPVLELFVTRSGVETATDDCGVQLLLFET